MVEMGLEVCTGFCGGDGTGRVYGGLCDGDGVGSVYMGYVVEMKCT